MSSEMPSLDDTQPNAPVTGLDSDTEPRNALDSPPPSSDSNGPGCAVVGFMTLTLGALALLIVILAGTAGYTAGERVANDNLTATDAALIGEQLNRIPTDVAGGNSYILAQRLNYLETVAPNIPAIPDLRITATQVYINNLPSQTPTSTETPTPTETPLPSTVPEVTVAPTQADTAPEATQSSGLVFDPAPLLQEARDQIARGAYADAYETLDAIIRIDENFERNTVRGLMVETLEVLANRAFASTETLAEAIRWTDLLEEYSAIEELDYERLLAGLFLDSQRAQGASDHLAAINALSRMISYQNTYKGVDLTRQLFNEYVDYGDAFVTYDQNHCRAVTQYDSALQLFNDQTVQGKRDAAQTVCERGLTATVEGGVGGQPGQQPEGEATVAPIGVPGG